MDNKGLSQERKETALQKSADSIYMKPKSPDLKVEEKYLISDMDVKEAVKKLTESVYQMQKPTANEESSSSSSGHRFYNWNTTHFYPDVHKLDIGILFRHNDKLNRLGFRNRDLSDVEPGYKNSLNNDHDNHKHKTNSTIKEQISKKMILARTLGRPFANGHINENGLGVKIDIDLDSGSDSNDDDKVEQWHKSPLCVSHIRRQDGRPLSAEISYDAASKKLYIHTLSKRLDTSGGKGLQQKGQGAKVLRRQSESNSETYNGFREHDRNLEKGHRSVSQQHFPVVANCASLATTQPHALSQIKKSFIKKPVWSQECLEKHNSRLDKGVKKEDKVVDFQSPHLSRSQDGMNYGETGFCKQIIPGHLKQPNSLGASPVIKMEFNGLAGNHFQPIINLKQLNERETSVNQSSLQCGTKSVGQNIGSSSSFENIYDSFSNAPKKVHDELHDRKVGKKEELLKEHIINDRVSKSISNYDSSASHKRSKTNKQTSKNTNEKKYYDRKSDFHQVEESVLLPKEKPVLRPNYENESSSSHNNSMQKKSHIDAKTIVEEEKQKFEDYKLQYLRQLSGQDGASEPNSQMKNVPSQKQLSSEEGITQSQRYIPPVDYVSILRKMYNNQDTLLCNEDKKITANAMNAENVSFVRSGEGIHILEHQTPILRLAPTVAMVNGQKTKAVQLPSEIYMDRHGYRSNASVVNVAAGSLGQSFQNQGSKPVSAFHRIIKTPDSQVEPVSLKGNPIQSRRPDLIPSPCVAFKVNTDTFYTGAKEPEVKEKCEKANTSYTADLVLTGYGHEPHAIKPETRLAYGNVGVLQKPPKPRKDEFSGKPEPNQWTYNTTYEPNMPPLGPDVQSAFSTIIHDKNASVADQTDKTGFRNSAFTDVIPADLPFPSSVSMNIFRSLPEQYRLSIQEPSSPVTDSLVKRNGSLPLYHKESGEEKQKLLLDPVFTKELHSQNLISKGDEKPYEPVYPSAAMETYLTDNILSRGDSGSNNQRYDKAIVFSLTGFHIPKNKNDNDRERDDFNEEIHRLDVGLQPSSQIFGSDYLKQTQWTDEEKRRPVFWRDADKRRPIVDWPDLDTVSPDLDFRSSPADAAYPRPFDYSEPTYNARDFDLKNEKSNQKNQRHAQYPYPHSGSLEGQNRWDLKSPTGEQVSPDHAASMKNYIVGVRSSEICNLKGCESRGSLSSDPQVFYAVKFHAKQETSDPGDKRNEISPDDSPLHPPRPLSRIPLYNQDPFCTFDSQNHGTDAKRQLFGETERLMSPPLRKERLMSPPLLQNNGALSNIKDMRSFSQPDVLRPNDDMTNFNARVKNVLDSKCLNGTQPKQNLSDNKEQRERKVFQNQSKASVEYEKHISQSQESHKAKTIQSNEPRLNEELRAKSLNFSPLAPSSSSFGEKLTKKVTLPKQKSELELHLSSSFRKHSESPATIPAEDCKRAREPFNIEVDFRPPDGEDSPQVYDMSVRLSGSQEKMDKISPSDEKVPQISVAAIKAKLFGQSEGKTCRLTDHQLAFQSGQNVTQNWPRDSDSAGKSKINDFTNKTQEVRSSTRISKPEELKDDERLYDYVSYRDGMKKKRSKINDHLTDFERIYEGLDLDNHDDNTHQVLPSAFCGDEFCPDWSNVKRLSITNLKLLTENQEKIAPNSNIEYTKEWIRTGKGYEPCVLEDHHVTSDPSEQAGSCSSQLDCRNLSARNVVTTVNLPRKQIDDMAYRKYGPKVVNFARSDPDLPVHFVQLCHSNSNATAEPTKSLSSLCHVGHNGSQECFSNKLTSGTTKKVELQTQLSPYQSPSYRNQLEKTIISKPPISYMDQSVKQMQPWGPNLRRLHRSSSFESSSREIKPEIQSSPSSGIGKLVELFEISQSAPDLTESGSFVGSCEETVHANVTPMTRKQKTPKDVKHKNEKRSKVHLVKLNADSGYVESESDSHSSIGMETGLTWNSALNGGRDTNMDSNIHKFRDTKTECYKQVFSKPETPEERTMRMKKLREDFFAIKAETLRDSSAFGFDQFQFTKKPSSSLMPQNRTIVVLPSAHILTGKNKEQSPSESGIFLPSPEPPYTTSNSISRAGNIVTLMKTNNLTSSSVKSSNEDLFNKGASLKAQQSDVLDLVKGPETQKTTLNLNLSIPAVAPETEKTFHGLVSFPFVDPKCIGNVVTHSGGPCLQMDLETLNPALSKVANIKSKEIKSVHIEKDEFVRSDKQTKSSSRFESEDKAFEQSKTGNEAVTEMKTQKIKVEPWQFEASRRFGRIVHKTTTNSVAHESQELQSKQESFSHFDVQTTKQHTRERVEQVYKIEKKIDDCTSVRHASDGLELAHTVPSHAKLSLLERLEFSDGEMTDGTDVTLDAIVHFNQLRPSSPETLDFSDVDVSSTGFSTKVNENQKGCVFTRTEVVQKSYEGSRTTCSKLGDITSEQTSWDNSSNQIMNSSAQEPYLMQDSLASAKAEMKLYRRNKEHKCQAEDLERRRSIKELVDSFEVMASPFMRTRQKSTEVRKEDIERAFTSRNTVD